MLYLYRQSSCRKIKASGVLVDMGQPTGQTKSPRHPKGRLLFFKHRPQLDRVPVIVNDYAHVPRQRHLMDALHVLLEKMKQRRSKIANFDPKTK